MFSDCIELDSIFSSPYIKITSCTTQELTQGKIRKYKRPLSKAPRKADTHTEREHRRSLQYSRVYHWQANAGKAVHFGTVVMVVV